MPDWSFQVAARTLCQEARDEPLDGQQAVGWVLRNRVADGRWGASLASVCLWHAQFSGWWCPRGTPSYHDPNFAYACDLSDSDPVLVAMSQVLADVLGADVGADPTGGATHYYAKSIAPPAWVNSATPCGQFGNQLFFRDVK